MKLLVTFAKPPFAQTATTAFAATLIARLNATDGLAAEPLPLPFRMADDRRALDAAMAFGLLRTLNVDHLVALNFPAFMMPYATRTVWLVDDACLPARNGGGRDGDILRRSTVHALNGAARLWCGSAALHDDLLAWCGVTADILPVPPADATDAAWAEVIARLIA